MLQEVNHAASSTAATVLLEIGKVFGGHTPNVFKAYAEHPALLAANWGKFKAVMLQGKLPRKVKEAMAMLISYDNRCKYCIAAHSAALRSLKISDPEIAAMHHGVLPDDFTQQEKALVKFARQANTHWHAIGNTDLQALFDLGIEKSEILEALGVVELFIAFNRCADVLGVEIDF